VFSKKKGQRVMSNPDGENQLKKELCDVLIRIDALKFGLFTLANGKLSPYFINLRIVPSFPEAFSKIKELYRKIAIYNLDIQDIKRVAAIPTAGIPFASVLALSLNKPFLYVRKELTRGRERRVEGILNPGDTVLLVDDLITTGNTLLTAADSIRSEGGVVQDALVLIDREEGGRKALKAQGIRLHNLICMTEAAQILYDSGVIDKENKNAIMRQITH
jgi:orotate phosphoribosyltransferase